MTTTTQNPRPAMPAAAPKPAPPAGPDSLSGHEHAGAHEVRAAEGTTSPQATGYPEPSAHAPAGGTAPVPAMPITAPRRASPVQDQTPPAAKMHPEPSPRALPAGTLPVPAIPYPAPNGLAPVRDQTPPAARKGPAPMLAAPLADPFLALAADMLTDLEKVRIANENRLRQLTRSTEDIDGETRGFGLDLANKSVARVAAMVAQMKCDSRIVLDLTGQKTPKAKGCCLEHDAERNLTRLLKDNPLWPWMAARTGIGAKQGARLLATLGDPYIRPEITRKDGTVEPSRPRTVSELWAYAGYHVVNISASGPPALGIHGHTAAGGMNGSGPGQLIRGTHDDAAGVAPKRQRGQRANWSAAAKMRAYLVAEKCVQAGKASDTPYYRLYAGERVKYATAVHTGECPACGPKGKPALPGSPLSDGHKHARALRRVAKEILLDLWREAKRLHEAGSCPPGAHYG